MNDLTPRPTRLHDSHASLSIAGARADNDDRVLARRDLGLYAIADGLGGARGGAVAAELAIHALSEAYSRVAHETFDASDEALAARLREAVTHANRTVFEARFGPNVAMGTTLVALARSRHHVAIAHVGDSRAMRLTGGLLETLTSDHSVRALLEHRAPSPAFLHRYGHLVTRALGCAPHELDVDLRVEPLTSRTRFLLASDGLTEYVDAASIASALARDAADAVAWLVDRAVAAGSSDNVSALVVDLGPATARTRGVDRASSAEAPVSACRTVRPPPEPASA